MRPRALRGGAPAFALARDATKKSGRGGTDSAAAAAEGGDALADLVLLQVLLRQLRAVEPATAAGGGGGDCSLRRGVPGRAPTAWPGVSQLPGPAGVEARRCRIPTVCTRPAPHSLPPRDRPPLRAPAALSLFAAARTCSTTGRQAGPSPRCRSRYPAAPPPSPQPPAPLRAEHGDGTPRRGGGGDVTRAKTRGTFTCAETTRAARGPDAIRSGAAKASPPCPGTAASDPGAGRCAGTTSTRTYQHDMYQHDMVLQNTTRATPCRPPAQGRGPPGPGASRRWSRRTWPARPPRPGPPATAPAPPRRPRSKNANRPPGRHSRRGAPRPARTAGSSCPSALPRLPFAQPRLHCLPTQPAVCAMPTIAAAARAAPQPSPPPSHPSHPSSTQRARRHGRAGQPRRARSGPTACTHPAADVRVPRRPPLRVVPARRRRRRSRRLLRRPRVAAAASAALPSHPHSSVAIGCGRGATAAKTSGRALASESGVAPSPHAAKSKPEF